MPRQKSLLTVIRDIVRAEVQSAMDRLLGDIGAVSRGKAKAKNGRRRRRRTRRSAKKSAA